MIARWLSCSLLVLLGSWLSAAARGAEEAESWHAGVPVGWQTRSPRPEMLPEFTYQGDPSAPAELIVRLRGGNSPGQHGWAALTIPVVGGRYYRFESWRRTTGVDSPRRSAPARVKWTNNQGEQVLADIPPGHEHDPGYDPQAEPEHPQDGVPTESGWVPVTGLFRAPSRATQAHVELHLQWAPHGTVDWRGTVFAPADPPAPRRVRLAAIHHTPQGQSPRANCEEFAPLIAQAAAQQAQLVVLGETVPYVRTGLKPHETAEPVPGPLTDYFAQLARQHQLMIVLSLYELDEGVVYNTAVLLGAEGQFVGKYRKVCLPHAEIEAGVTPGSEYPVFDTPLGKVGLMVCYDGFFPEVARQLSAQGAEIIAWPVWGCNPLLARARACENHVFLVSSTYSAGPDWMTTAVFARNGEPLIEAQQFGEVVTAEVDLSQPHFWKNNLGDFRAMIPRHRPAEDSR